MGTSWNVSAVTARVIVAGVAAIALAVAGASAAGAAVPSSEATLEDGGVIFAVIGDLPSGEFPVEQLAELGVTPAEVDLIGQGEQAALDGLQVAPLAGVNDPYRVMASWTDSTGKAMALRWGSSTWGWYKIVNKHNLTTAVARTTTKYPKTRVVESASAIVYRTPVNNVKCNTFGFCSVAATRTVKVVANPLKLNDGSPKGVITAYCEGITWCESWVKNAINT